MNIFKGIKLNWWQLGMLKASLISFGIIIGLNWASFFLDLLPLLWIIFIITAAYILYLWFKQ